jgi:hypothetical protein
MLRCLVSAIFSVVLLAQTVLGVGVQLIEGLPSAYTPGQPVTFDVRLPAMTNLGSYNIDLVLDGAAGTAGVDFFFDVPATIPAATNYVFPSSANFFDAVTLDSPTRHRITLSDFDLTGVNVVPGSNDRVANVVLRTSPGFRGQLGLFVHTDGLILDTSDINPTPVAGFDSLKSNIAASGTIQIEPVPEPSVACLAGAGVLGALLWRHRLSNWLK